MLYRYLPANANKVPQTPPSYAPGFMRERMADMSQNRLYTAGRENALSTSFDHVNYFIIEDDGSDVRYDTRVRISIPRQREFSSEIVQVNSPVYFLEAVDSFTQASLSGRNGALATFSTGSPGSGWSWRYYNPMAVFHSPTTTVLGITSTDSSANFNGNYNLEDSKKFYSKPTSLYPTPSVFSVATYRNTNTNQTSGFRSLAGGLMFWTSQFAQDYLNYSIYVYRELYPGHILVGKTNAQEGLIWDIWKRTAYSSATQASGEIVKTGNSAAMGLPDLNSPGNLEILMLTDNIVLMAGEGFARTYTYNQNTYTFTLISEVQLPVPDSQIFHFAKISYGRLFLGGSKKSSLLSLNSTNGAMSLINTSYSLPSVDFAKTHHSGKVACVKNNAAFMLDFPDPDVIPPAPVSIWTERTLPSTGNWSDIIFANGQFVAVGHIIATSPDGINWDNRHSSPGLTNAITYGNGKYVATTFSSGLIYYSNDGIVWESTNVSSLLNGGVLRDVSYGNGVFVAVLENTNRVLTSTDGITWTPRNISSNSRWATIAYGKGKFIMASLNSSVSLTSTDGISWTSVALPASQTENVRIDFYKNQFIVSQFNSGIYSTSPDGTAGSWTARSRTSGQYYGGASSPESYMTISYNTNTSYASSNGISWTPSPMPTGFWIAIAQGNGVFVAIASSSNKAATTPSG